MSRVRNIVDRFSKAARNGTIDSDGSINTSSAINVVTATDDDSLLGLDTSNHTDGSLHYRTSDHATYVYDDSEDKYYPLTISSDALKAGFNGAQFGYAGGGNPYPSYGQKIQKFSFTSDGNATDVGNLNTGRSGTAGSASTTHGYISGGHNSIGAANTDREKWLFASDANLTQVSSTTWPVAGPMGNSSPTHGYGVAGYAPTIPTIGFRGSYKFPFASDADTLVSGPDLSFGHTFGSSTASETDGYIAAGYHNPGSPPAVNNIEKYPFANDNAAASHGTTFYVGTHGSGTNSTTHSYISGNTQTAGNTKTNIIQKFPFATDAGSTDVANMTVARQGTDGSSSASHGYAAGGATDPAPATNVIDKFDFAADGNSTDVGDLTTAGSNGLLGQVHF